MSRITIEDLKETKMNDNLIFYINKLSHLIVSQELENDKSEHWKKKTDRFYNNCVKKVRQKGCDVLLNQHKGAEIQDPCITDYGGNWSPLTLITDYGRELQAQGAGKYNELLVSWISTLEEREYDCIEDLLKLLLLLKKPLDKDPMKNYQSELSVKTSDYLLNGMDSLFFLNEEFSSEGLSKTSTNRKALQYEESWTKHFDPKFQLLGEFSKKNLHNPDKLSLKSIFSSQLIVVPSHTNSFGFTDFSCTRNYKSEKSLFNINSNIYFNDNALLDSFVDRPILHKLPSLKLNMKFSCKSGFLEKTSSHSCSEEDKQGDSASIDENSRKSSVIELKRNSNCCHSFSILYEKTGNDFPDADSNEALGREEVKKSPSPSSTSKEIILGLWEQEQSLIREFRPDLATTLPTLRMITHVQFIEDVKYLFTGINSNTFKYDPEKDGFTMVYGTCLDDVTPESLYHFSKEFMEIGDSYVKLISSVYETGRNCFDVCTTISQAFWKSIFDYLELHYSLVLEIPVTTNLMALKSCTRELHEIITTVARICKVNSKDKTLPQGGELLSYLLQVAEEISKECVTNIVFGILQNCCRVYYACVLQNWMFNGRLENQNNEFFVDYRRQNGKTKSRSYYNSFFLMEDKVPTFLRGYEESFYNCGKSIHFLKLFNPKDSLCQLLDRCLYPTMRLCFTDEQLEKLDAEFKEYENRALETCGDKITVKKIKEEEKEKEKIYQNYVKECKALQEKEREETRLKQLEEMKTRKEEKNKLLNEQRNSIDAERERRKRTSEEEEVRFHIEMKRRNEERENLLNEEKTKLKKFYGELMNDVDREIMVSKARVDGLKKIIEEERRTEETTNEVNYNEFETDHEGNITANLDLNLNPSSSNSDKRKEEISIASSDVSESFVSCSCVSYDENLNPCREETTAQTEETNGNTEEINANIEETNGNVTKERTGSESENNLRKSVSYRTIAAEEAAKNRCKILKSEFGIPMRYDPETKAQETKSLESMTDLERNRAKVLESEYNIVLKKTMTHISLRVIPSETEMPQQSRSQGSESKLKGEKLTSFTEVALERKPVCLDLQQPVEIIQPVVSRSSESNDFSVENVSNTSEETELLQIHRSSSVVLSEKYKDALTRDAEIFLKKNSRQDIFCSLKEEEIDNLPCTDFLKFQRYLRKSALIPLKAQEKLANDALLKQLLKGENLLSHLNSLRGYFFLNDGEFGRSFTHQIFRSLTKCTEPTQFFERGNLSNIVNEALNYSIHGIEPNSQNLSFRIVKMPPFLNHSSHDVLAPFELTYRVDWPLNFIITEKALSKYKMVFKFLLKLKRINWTLNENFLYLNSHFKNHRVNGKVLVGSSHYHKIQVFRHAMTQVMITLDDYIFSNGIQFPWIFFLKDLETTENIDHLYQKHVRYIKDVLARCFLSKNSEDLLDCIHNLIELALKYHYTSKSSPMVVVNGKYEHPKFTVLKGTFNEFCCIVKTFLKTLKEKLTSNEVVRSHYVLIEKFDLKLT